jgi:hypothetical protein
MVVVFESGGLLAVRGVSCVLSNVPVAYPPVILALTVYKGIHHCEARYLRSLYAFTILKHKTVRYSKSNLAVALYRDGET